MKIAEIGGRWFCVAIAVIGVGLTSISAGCQSPGRVLSSETSLACPECRTETRTAPIKGLTYKKHICASCRMVEDDAVTDDPIEWTHVCDRCKARVGECAQCRRQ